MENYSLFLS